ncbi:Bicyclomycin resistance protein [Pigmentiphaga humi]|uniref:Bcr/CflA family efflux transporter n=1 Tax=Pigmentiphaga humi TaxID=2478468 RepID=A0A3P4B4Z7_9BURK|nr:Bcr/CflA family efflux MFS transporter [Pigmentiphaga humi]VCU70738.1 Bicyclomycin resistance protein [Pigmentiphaga humi]
MNESARLSPQGRVALPVGFIVVLGLLAGLPPLTIDISLPGLPAIGAELGASAVQMQATLGAFMLTFGFGQLIWGPLSDRHGRLGVILLGLAVYVAAAIACMLAQSGAALIGWRAVQGFGASAASVAGIALVRDVFPQPQQRATIQSFITAVLSVAPIVAPLIGAFVIHAAGWRGLFAVLAGVAVLLAVTVSIRLRAGELRALRSRQPAAPAAREHESGAAAGTPGYRGFLALPRALALLCALGLVFCGMFVFISGSPFVLIDGMGVSRGGYAIAFALASVAVLAGSLSTARLSHRGVPPRRVLMAGARGAACAGLAALAVGFALRGAQGQGWEVALFVAAMGASLFFGGFIMPTIYTLGLQDAGAMAGVGAAMLGASQMLGGALGSTAVGMLPIEPVVAVGGLAALCGVAMWAVARAAFRHGSAG